MYARLSNKEITSYTGDVLPLRLLADRSIEDADIIWSAEGGAVSIRDFKNEPEQPFNDGILIRFENAGVSTVRAELDGKVYECRVTVKERLRAKSESKLNYYRGDLHTHTTRFHTNEAFVNRDEGFQSDMVGFIKNENLLDFGVLSDHSDVMLTYGFFRGFCAVEDAKPMDTVLFPGSESENMYVLPDRIGNEIRRAGEIVVINADYLACTDTWEKFIDAFKYSKEPIGIFAHPALDKWDFNFEENSSRSELVRMMRLVEMGNGSDVKNNLLHEYAFSRALDSGFRVTTSCGSDGHATRGYKICPGKTIIMAPEKSKEAFADALLNLRAYACESANVKLAYTVNGSNAPCDLNLTDSYDFNISIDYFCDDESTRIVKCQVISDGGSVVFEMDGLTESTLSFNVHSDTARYFYLRLVDRLGRRTFSPPVFCSRPYDRKDAPNLTPHDAKGYTAHDGLTKTDATQILTVNPECVWTNGETRAEIIIDMQCEKELSALGNYIGHVPKREKTNPSSNCARHAGYPRKYEISVSLDGKNYAAVSSGMFRYSCGEEIVSFKKCRARYVKLRILTTVGMQYEREEYRNSPLQICGITLFKDN